MRAFAADPPAAPANDPTDAPAAGAQSLAQFRQELAQRRPGIVAELAGTDADKVQQAIAEIDEWAEQVVSARRADLYEMLVDTKHYDEADERIIKAILRSPASNFGVEHLQKLRVRSLLKQGKAKEALSAARAYYDVCRLAETQDAIAVVTTCLMAAHPDDPTIAKRFKAQQAAGATAATQPAGGDPGPPILASIPPEQPPPVPAAEIDGRVPTGYIGFEAKGNLLLLVGRSVDAKAVFEQARAVASDAQMAGAIENVARAIRAGSGTVAPANAYVASVQQAKK